MKWALIIFISIGFCLCGYTIFLSSMIIDNQEYKYRKLQGEYSLVKHDLDSFQKAAEAGDTLYFRDLNGRIFVKGDAPDPLTDQIDTANFQPLEGGHIPNDK
jgi:hypothetical protein